MTYWTIAVAGAEKQWADWLVGIDSSIEFANRAAAVANIRTSEPFDTGPTQWLFKQHVIIYRDRTSTDGTPNSFSGGSIAFQGYFDDPRRVLDGSRQNVEYRAYSLWWLMQRNPFKQHRNEFSGWDRTHQRVATGALNAGGTGYQIGDVLTVVGGTGSPLATFTVTNTGPGGAATVIAPANIGGVYTVPPPSPAALSGGHGTGAQATVASGFVPTFTDVVMSEVYLGEAIDSANGVTRQQHSGDQVKEILNWMNETYNPTRRGGAPGGVDPSQDILLIGTVDPRTFFPVIPVTGSIRCAEGVIQSLRFDPDAIVYEDPTTTPPTINVKRLARWDYTTTPPTFLDYTNLPELTITLTADQERQVLLQGRQSRALPGVIIYYIWINVVDGTQARVTLIDKFPDGVTPEPGGNPPLQAVTDYTPEVSSHAVELAGSRQTFLSAVVRTNPISQLTAGAPSDQVAWWQAHDKTLNPANDPLVTNVATVGTPTVLDETGAAINTTLYAYELLDTALPEWIQASKVRATVSQQISFDRWTDATHTTKDHSAGARPHTQRVLLITLPGGYYSGGSLLPNEAAPQNVAQSVFRAAAAQLWAGQIELLDAQVRSGLTLGQRLKFVGPTTTFTNVLVQSIQITPGRGTTSVRYGSEWDALDVDMWIELARAARARNAAMLPSGRADGGLGSQGSQQDGASAPDNNTAHGAGGFSLAITSFLQS